VAWSRQEARSAQEAWSRQEARSTQGTRSTQEARSTQGARSTQLAWSRVRLAWVIGARATRQFGNLAMELLIAKMGEWSADKGPIRCWLWL